MVSTRVEENQNYTPITEPLNRPTSWVAQFVAHRTLPFLDLIALTVAFVLGYYARMVLPFFPVPRDPPALAEYIPVLIVHLVVNITFFYVTQLYHQRRVSSILDMIRSLVGTLTVGTLVTSALQEFIYKNSAFEVDYPRGMFFYIWIISFVILAFGRVSHRLLVLCWRRKGRLLDNLLIIGTGTSSHELINFIDHSPSLGFQVVGVVSNASKLLPKGKFANIPIIGHYEQLPEIIDRHQIEHVVIALPTEELGQLAKVIGYCRRGRVDIKVFPELFSLMTGEMILDDVGGKRMVSVQDIVLRGWRLSLKRGMDIVGAIFGMILFSPLMMFTSLLIKFQRNGPVFHIQQRMGMDGKPFSMIKFRSMREDADVSGPGWTVKNDPRITRLGRLMRRTSWDEMPQLINVLLGQMSLVGPRPEQPYYVREFRQRIPRYMDRHQEKAGMTGWAQVNGLRGDTSISERTRFDLWYVEHWSLWLDFKIILRTLFQIVRGGSPSAY
ncbi:MAG: undecaprenyl-phosphate glucose phosphotransferase [Chloroflexi bacterium]|nr:undecaprenyl-phosphate glucose phosphotransferase [Chloroflexota bacterium]